MTVDMAGRLGLGSASEKHIFLLTKIRLVLQFLSAQTKKLHYIKKVTIPHMANINIHNLSRLKHQQHKQQ